MRKIQPKLKNNMKVSNTTNIRSSPNLQFSTEFYTVGQKEKKEYDSGSYYGKKYLNNQTPIYQNYYTIEPPSSNYSVKSYKSSARIIYPHHRKL